MNRHDALEGVGMVRRALRDCGVALAVTTEKVRGDWMIVVRLSKGEQEEVVRSFAPMSVPILEVIREKADELRAGDSADVPEWLRKAAADLLTVEALSATRQLALAVIGDIEAEELPRPIVNGLDDGISVAWEYDDCWLELWFPRARFVYEIRAQMGQESPPWVTTVVPSVKRCGRGVAYTTCPEYVRGVLDMMFIDHPGGGPNRDADDVLAEFGFTEAEIAALDESEK